MAETQAPTASGSVQATPGPPTVVLEFRSVAPTPAAVAAPATNEIGISGTTNYQGRLAVEPNTKLQHEQAFGLAGTLTWGEWERLVRTDPACASALEPMRAQLRDARVDVEAAEGVKNGQAHADFLEWNLTERMAPGWDEVIQQMANALPFGFALHELVLVAGESKLLPGGFGYVLEKLAERLPSSVHPNGWLEKNGELVTIRQHGVDDTGRWRDSILLPADKVLLTTWNRTGNNYQGWSIFRPVWYVAKIREQLLKVLAVGMQRESCGIPAAVSNPGAKVLLDADRERLELMLANLVYHENASVVLPEGWDIKWIFSAGANKSSVLAAWSQLGLVILEQAQAQQQYLGTSNTGSRAVGQVHDAGADSFAQGVTATLEGVLNGVGSRPYTGLAKKLIDANWGPQTAYPNIRITLKKSKLAAADRTAASLQARQAGLLTPTSDDENVMREELGFEPMDVADLDALREKAAKPPPPPPGMVPDPNQPQNQPGAPPGAPAGKQPTPTVTPKTAPGAPPAAPAKLMRLGSAPGGFTPHRDLRPDEQHVDFAAMDDFMSRARVDFEAEAKPLVAEMLVRALPDIKRAMDAGNPSAVADLKLDTSKLGPFVQGFLGKVRSEGASQLRAEHARGTDIAKKRQDGDPATATAPVKLAAGDEQDDFDPSDDSGGGDSEPRRFLQQKAALLIRRIQGAVQIDLEREAIDGARTGATANEVMTMTIGRLIDSGQLRSQVGSVIPTAFNEGREDYAATQDVDTVTLSALLDGGQCGPCEDLDGETYDYGSDEHEEHTPPLTSICDGRDNCRCVLTFQWGGSNDA